MPGLGDFRAQIYARYASSRGLEASTVWDGFDAWCEHRYLPHLRQLPPDARILELGCGDGRFLSFLTRHGFSHARGVDISPEQVAAALSRGLAVAEGDALAALSSEHASLGAVIAFDFLEHLSRDELIEVLPSVRRALRRDGLLLAQTVNAEGLFPRGVMYGDITHMTFFTPRSLAQLLRACGFAIVQAFPTGPLPTTRRGRLDALAWRGITAVANGIRVVETGKRQAIWTETFICVARAS